MGAKAPLVLPVTGDLDTSAPITNRAFGTLVRAKDVHPRRWGPREGSQSFARVWESPGVASLYDGINLTTGADTYGTGLSYEDQFRDLGTKWTLDLWFRLSSSAYAAGKDKIGLYKFVVNASGVIEVSITGPSHATPACMQIYIVTNPSAGLTDTPVTTVYDTTPISIGSTQADKHHFRLVRNGAAINGILNGVVQTVEVPVSLVATSGILAAPGTAAVVGLGKVYGATDPLITLKGQIFGAVLRDGAFSTRPIEATMPCNPHARNVHHYYLGRNIALGGVDHYFDAGRFGAHARISGAGYSVTSSNDNTAPAPAPVQGLASWNTRGNRTATAVVCGGQLSVKGVS